MKRLYLALQLSVLLLISSCAGAALPLAVDGQKLPSLAPMLKDVQPAVVNIATVIRGGSAGMSLEELYRRRFNLPPRQSRPSQSRGSGVIVNADRGLVITNHHVIDGADEISVTTKDGRSFDAELVGSDAGSDVAILRIDADNITAIELGVSGDLNVGDFVVAIGSPFGLSQTVTSGIVSALGRSGLGIEGYEDFIQTDASINPGNSGGALVNLRGELIGINTAILSRTGGSVGIGFAIPIDMVSTLMNQLVEFGDVKRGLLGVRMQDLTPPLADAFGISGKKGAVVSEVIKGSAAEDVGIQEGDVIVKFNDSIVNDSADLRNAVGLLRAGSEGTVSFYRNGTLKTVKATIKATDEIVQNEEGAIDRLDGARLRTAEAEADQPAGVQVVEIEPNSPADSTGLLVDDIITEVNRQKVESLDALKKIAKRSDGVMLIKLIRENRSLFLVIQ
ncbi:MAG: Do family serine endopeptidase [Pseudomonadota bacterium]